VNGKSGGGSDNAVVLQFFSFFDADTQQAAENFIVECADLGAGPVRAAGSVAELRHHAGNLQRFTVDLDLFEQASRIKVFVGEHVGDVIDRA